METPSQTFPRIIITGASGMVGGGILNYCLESPQIGKVLSLGRSPLAISHPKLEQALVKDFGDLAGVEAALTGYDACLHCMGISAVGLSEAEYLRITYDLSLNLAQTLLRLNPALGFAYVSGAGTDSTEKGRTMWARVKGKTENALLALPFRHVHVFRPAFIEPAPGISSKTRLYKVIYDVVGFLTPVLRLFPGVYTSTRRLGNAMLQATLHGLPKMIMESKDINRVGEQVQII